MMKAGYTENEIVIHAGTPLGHVNRNIYGHFAEHLGECIYGGLWVGPESGIPNRNGIRTDVVEALRKIKVPVLRWPGGCFADDYHWKDGIGPPEQRPRRVNRWWDDVETNRFGTHEFLELCALLGCEPYICGNVGSGTVEEMAAWNEYLNCGKDTTLARLRARNGHPEPFHVTYWGVGNENWGCGGNMSPVYYAHLYKQYATYLTDFNPDRPLFKIACGASAFDYSWTEQFFKTVSGKNCDCPSRLHLVDGFAFHYYSGSTGSATRYTDLEWYIMLLKGLAIEELIEEHRRVMDKYDPNRQVGLICDEWGTWHPAEEGTNPKWLRQQNTIRDAVLAAMTLDIFNNNADRIVMANIAQLVNVLQAMILTDGPKMLCTPTYHVYDLYSPHQDGTALHVDIDTPLVSQMQIPKVSGSCTVKDSVFTLSLVNCCIDEAADVNVVFKGIDGLKLAAVRQLATGDIHDHNTFDDPCKVSPKDLDVDKKLVRLEPASVTVATYEKTS